MSLRAKIFGQLARAVNNLAGPNVWKNVASFGGGSVSSAASELGQSAAMTSPAEKVLWVYNCMNARAGAIQQAQLRVSDGNDNILDGGPLFDLLETPNEDMDGVQFMGAVESCLALYNLAVILPWPLDAARPDSLYILPPNQLTPITATHESGVKTIGGWSFYADGKQYAFDATELITIAKFNPHSPTKALSPLGPLEQSLLMDLATRDANLKLYRKRQGAHVGGVRRQAEVEVIVEVIRQVPAGEQFVELLDTVPPVLLQLGHL